MAASDSIRIGLVGSGFLAKTRARCYRRVAGVRAELVAVASSDPDKAMAFAAEHGVAQVESDVYALLARDDIDLVDLCVPNHLHRRFAVAAAEAGKHVVCTKPLTAFSGHGFDNPTEARRIAKTEPGRMLELALADGRAMIAAAEAAGTRLLYGENWIYAPSVVKARELAAASGGVLLEMRGWEAHSGSHAEHAKSWELAGGGALLRLGAHPIGAMLQLKREEGQRLRGIPTRPVAVTAEVADLSRAAGLAPERTAVATGWKGVENWGCVNLAFSDGTRATAFGSDVQLGGMQSRLELMGSNFRLSCNLSPNDLVAAYAPDEAAFDGVYLQEKLGTRAGWSTPMPDEDWSSGHLAMCEAFVGDVAGGRAPLADGSLGLDVVEVVYAAYLSAAEGRRVALGARPAEGGTGS
ncbi:MAG: Gfo/Idh/MocA family oxidoreductase [Planctomycetes bacterium]|nr:Gfo/Idh/MocA family oxidoreductase [Planctomycetota bacterium]